MTMKKFLMSLTALLLMLGMVCVTACGTVPEEPMTAERLFEKIDAAMDALDSYEVNGTMVMDVYMGGYKMETTADIRQIESGVTTGDYYFYSDSDVKMNAPLLGVSESVKTVEAYHDGKAFLSTENSEVCQKIYSPMTDAEFRTYYEEKNTSVTDDNMMDCTNAVFTELEDGSWELSLSGYTKKTVDAYAKEIGFDGELFDDEIMDMELAIKADAEFRVTQMIVRLIFDTEAGSAKVPKAEMTMDYGAYNAATRITDTLNIMNFIEVEDIRLLDTFEKQIEALGKEKQNTFSLDITQTFKLSGQTSSYSERDMVTYGENEDGYFYDILAEMSGVTYEINYRGGQQTIRVEGAEESTPQTEDEARDYVMYLINTCRYDKQYVSDIEKTAEGVYKVVVNDPEDASYEQVMAQMGMEYHSSSQTIIFTMKDGKITQIKSTVDVYGRPGGTGTALGKLTVSSTAIFE